MATPSWSISGQYYESCSCDFVCPCMLSQLTAPPTKGSCTFVMGFQVERGTYGAVPLEGLGFIMVILTPREMAKGDWSVGLIVDERASAEQRDAVATIVSGKAGGPLAAVAGLVGRFLGVESSPIRFDRAGVKWSVTASDLLDMAAEGVMGINPEATEPLQLANTGHPAADTVALCRASRGHVRAFGLSWDDDSGRNYGQNAPFAWQGN